MKSRILGRMLTVAALAAGALCASIPDDSSLARSIRHEVLMYPRYTMWDDIAFRVENGRVELNGEVTQPYKKDELGKIVASIPGVTAVTNDLKVLPFSTFDDRLRIQVARAIYGDPVLSRYGMGAIPSIHIIVDNGHVTLTGSVATENDRQVAFIRASGAGLAFGPVDNRLSVEQPAKSKKS